MRLPDGEKAEVPESKVTGYLLSLEHPAGKSKARLFRKHGFGDDSVELLRSELLRIAARDDVELGRATPFGTKYELVGDLRCPEGVLLRLRTIWIIEAAGSPPRFVTAYPA
jgi:hypothetical protein